MQLHKCLTAAARVRGYTVIELLTVVSVAGILAAIAVPNFNSFRVNQRATGRANDLVADIHAARARAVFSSTRAEIVPVGTWSRGWNVDLIDRSNGSESRVEINKRAIDSSDESITAVSGSEAVDLIAFEANGALSAPTGGVVLHVCVGSPKAQSRDVVIMPSGFAEVRRDSSHACL
ncbi:MAG TPA: GspH/FimT family pseudopilin [Tahibacter sp.]|nr:GspH/FimT family pseudopilin [Tahibacter sp.]